MRDCVEDNRSSGSAVVREWQTQGGGSEWQARQVENTGNRSSGIRSHPESTKGVPGGW